MIEAQVKAHYGADGAADDEHGRERHGADSLEGHQLLRHRARRSTPRTVRKGFGAHSDQERILEAELHRFVRFQIDVVMALAATRN